MKSLTVSAEDKVVWKKAKIGWLDGLEGAKPCAPTAMRLADGKKDALLS